MQQNSPTGKLRIHFEHKKLYKMYTTDVYKTFTKSKELCQLDFVYIMYKKVCRNMGYILYTVKPVYNDHLGDKVSAVVIDRLPL